MKTLLAFLFSIFLLSLQAQDFSQYDKYISAADSILLTNLPKLKLPEEYKGANAKELPDTLNNSILPFFPPVFTQYGWSCGQASSIGYLLTYEVNSAYNDSAILEENQMTPEFTFNFYNKGVNNIGVNYLHSFDVAKHVGNPNVLDYASEESSLTKWVSGYDTYYHGMFNRVDEVYAIHVGNQEGLQTLKYWMLDHLNGSTNGGIANFYTDLSSVTVLPPNTPEEGKTVITEFGSYQGHSMSFVGWNDSIRYDYNGDNEYTNDIDINGDGEVNMKDWEIGGVILANSWGDDWGDNGFSYVMYQVLAREKINGGIWNKQVNVIDVKHDYQPQITYKIKLKHSARNRIKVMAGVSSDTNSMMPEKTMDFPIFNYQGGDNYMQGDNSIQEHKIIEFGLDVTPLLSEIEDGQPAKFFLQIHENDPLNINIGEIMNFSLMDYSNELLEIPCSVEDTAITNNGFTTISVVHSINFNKVKIETEELPAYVNGEAFSFQLTASGGTEPYSWDIEPGYTEIQEEETYPEIQGENLSPNNNDFGFAKQNLDFSFPFYGANYDSVYVHVDGYLMFDETPLPLPYQADDLFLFKNVKMVSPFSTRNLYVSNSTSYGLWYEGDQSHAAFRWIARLESEQGDIPVDFTVIIFPDGTIEYFYNDFESSEDEYKVIGISNGNNKSFKLSTTSNVFAKTNVSKITYIPDNLAHSYKIDEDGTFHFNAAFENTINNLNIQVTDYFEISNTKLFQLSDGLIFNYQVSSGENDRIEYGDTVKVSLNVKNISENPIDDINLNAVVNSSYITLLSYQTIVGTLNPQESIDLTDVVSFIVHSNVPDMYSFLCELYLSSSSGNWSGNIGMEVFSPEFQFSGPTIIDNENGRLDPGETVEMLIHINNLGHADAFDVMGEFIIDDPYVTINTANPVAFGEITAGGLSQQSISVSASTDTPQGYIAQFESNYTAWPDITLSYDFELLVGRFPVFIIDLDPDTISGPKMKAAIDELEVLNGYGNFFPPDLNIYSNIILSLGRKWSKYVLSEYEGQLLANYLNAGGNLYIEGGETWFDDPETPVHSMFHFDVSSVNLHACYSLTGEPGTFAEGMYFNYDGPIVLFNHFLEPNQDAFGFFTNTDEQYCYAIAYEDDVYKTIGTNFDFGGLTDDEFPSTKKVLMAEILNFFGIDITIISTEEFNSTSSTSNLSCVPNPIFKHARLNFSLSEKQNVTLQIFDIHGSLIKTLVANKIFIKGEHQIKLNSTDLTPGLYVAELSTRKAISNTKIIVTK